MVDKKIDPYEFTEIISLNKAISLIEEKSHTGDAKDKVYEALNELIDDIEVYGVVDKTLLNNAKKVILDSSKYAGYTNIQHNLKNSVREILDEI